MVDFNHKVASQFGENYRELGDAVRQLLTWQEEYRETIRTTNLQLADTLRQLGYAAGDFRAVTTGSAQFAQTAERVARIMDGIEAGENRLMVLAHSVARVTEEASGRIPFIEARIAELTSQMMRAVQENQEAVHAALTGSAEAMQRTVGAVQAELSAGSAGVQENQRAIATALQDNAASMAASLQAAQDGLTAVISGFEAQMTAMIEANMQRVMALDGSAAAGLSQSVGNLVGSLTAQLEAASAGLAERAKRPRPVLHVVGEASAVADQ